MEGLEDVCPHRFIGIANMAKIVKSESYRLQAGDSAQQYLIFRPVTEGDLVKIDSARDSIGKHTRMTHYADADLLIVKLMPSAKHEGAHRSFAEDFVCKLTRIGILKHELVAEDFVYARIPIPNRELFNLGSTRFYGPHSSKEADTAYKPSTLKNEDDWPTLVFESGLSEKLSRLRVDAAWWLGNSGGKVKIVIIFAVRPEQTKIQIEKWELAPVAERRPSTRAFPNNPDIPPQDRPQVPTKMQAISISPGAITGAPLVLEFQKVFLRLAVPPEPENDITFTAQELSDWAAHFWDVTRT